MSRELLLFALSPFFSVFIFLYLVFSVGSVAGQWNGLNLLVAPKIVSRNSDYRMVLLINLYPL